MQKYGQALDDLTHAPTAKRIKQGLSIVNLLLEASSGSWKVGLQPLLRHNTNERRTQRKGETGEPQTVDQSGGSGG